MPIPEAEDVWEMVDLPVRVRVICSDAILRTGASMKHLCVVYQAEHERFQSVREVPVFMRMFRRISKGSK